MLLRRLLVGGPLAVLVAVLAHVVGFGFAHAPGTAHALDLAVALGSALATLGSATVLWGSARENELRARSTIASVAELSAFAALAFVAIEALEGNVALGGSLRAFAALVPIAMLVAWLAPRADTKLREFGISLRASLQRYRDDIALCFARASTRLLATSQTTSSRCRGRAPPQHA